MHKTLLEAFDKSLQELCRNIRPFGSSLILLAEGFRKTSIISLLNIQSMKIHQSISSKKYACLKYTSL